MTISISRRHLISAAAASIFAPSAAMATARTPVTGAGSSFIRPVMLRWIELAPKTLPANPTYTAIGTGVAQSKILSGDIDFAAVELPLPAETVENGQLLQFPLAFGALACVVNIPGIAAEQLRLSGELLGAIYTGGIKKWNDPKIAAANPGLTLPDLDITPLRLATVSGTVFSTTHTFTQYLLATNQDMRQKYGTTLPRRWAVGAMVDDAENMVETVKVMTGSIGYMALGTAINRKLTTVLLKNKAGKAVGANLASLQASVAQIDWAKATGMVVEPLNLPGEGSWPIVLPSYMLLQRKPSDAAQGVAVRAFTKFVLSDGAEGAASRHATMLPAAQKAAVLAMLG